jgi:hypothetical protein
MSVHILFNPAFQHNLQIIMQQITVKILKTRIYLLYISFLNSGTCVLSSVSVGYIRFIHSSCLILSYCMGRLFTQTFVFHFCCVHLASFYCESLCFDLNWPPSGVEDVLNESDVLLKLPWSTNFLASCCQECVPFSCSMQWVILEFYLRCVFSLCLVTL